jgi:hypothetical protein
MIFNKNAKMPRKKLYPLICTIRNEEKETGIYDSMSDLTLPEEKQEGDEISFDALGQGYQTSITSRTIAKGIHMSREKLEYDLYGVINANVGDRLVRVMQIKKEIEIADRYNNAFTTASADGQYQIDSDHPLVDSDDTNSNLATGALTTDNLVAAKNMFIDIKDQAGNLFDTYPTTLLINDKKQYEAMQILESPLVAFEMSNTKNVVNALNPIHIVSNRWIDYDDGVSPWFLIDDTLEDAGVILQVKKPMWVDMNWIVRTQMFEGGCFEMYGSGVVSPGYKIVGSTGA